MLAAGLRKYGVTTPAAELYDAVWKRIVVIEESIEVVHALRRSGYGVHLGTNQEHRRGAHMRTALGYDDLFDVSCYSHELGVAKPDPQFFTQAADRISAPIDEILFIDDRSRNVEGARAAACLPSNGTSRRGTTYSAPSSPVTESAELPSGAVVGDDMPARRQLGPLGGVRIDERVGVVQVGEDQPAVEPIDRRPHRR